jgi:hypothetical protein
MPLIGRIGLAEFFERVLEGGDGAAPLDRSAGMSKQTPSSGPTIGIDTRVEPLWSVTVTMTGCSGAGPRPPCGKETMLDMALP